ncbi:MAG: hypothetical protein C4290_14685 [Chloroflexota bacterium]
MMRGWATGGLVVVVLVGVVVHTGGVFLLLARPATVDAGMVQPMGVGREHGVAAMAALPGTATVTVQPTSGFVTDTFTFSLAGYAPRERVVVHVQPPSEAVNLLRELAGLPEDTVTAVDETGAGRFALRPAETWGPSPPGIWRVWFTGETSGMSADAAIELQWCGC